MFRPGSVVGSTFFASREPVRDPMALRMVHGCRAISSKAFSTSGSMALRRPSGMLVTSEAAFDTMEEDKVLELRDYDPVRRTSIVIGISDPTPYVPLHWLALRTHPDHDVSLKVDLSSAPEGIKVFESRTLKGSFEEAMEVVKTLKGEGTDRIFLSGRGLLLLFGDLDELLEEGIAFLSGLPPDEGGEGKGDRKDPGGRGPDLSGGQIPGRKDPNIPPRPREMKPTGRKKRPKYKRGPTRREKKGD